MSQYVICAVTLELQEKVVHLSFFRLLEQTWKNVATCTLDIISATFCDGLLAVFVDSHLVGFINGNVVCMPSSETDGETSLL